MDRGSESKLVQLEKKFHSEVEILCSDANWGSISDNSAQALQWAEKIFS